MNLSDRGELTGFLRKHGLKADKSLGQHFLCAPNVVLAIVSAAEPFESCLEIGPGPGILTSFLATKAEHMVAIEFDERMIPLLADSAPSCRVIHGDALKVDLSEVLGAMPEPRALVSNMPYYITGPLLEKFSQVRSQLNCLVLMMQKEVGTKILAEPGNRERGSLSVNLQAEFKVERVINVPGGCFMPPPKVDSIVLKLTPRNDVFPDKFGKVVRASFRQPRKTLLNNLVATFRQDREAMLQVLMQNGLIETARAFELQESQWIDLSTSMMKLGWV